MSVTQMTTQHDPLGKLRAQVKALEPELRNALPSHIKPEKFQRVVMTVVQQQQELLEADRRSLLGACMKCAADGLVPDGREAALVIFNAKGKDERGREVWEKHVQYMPMMAGILKRIRNSNEVASVQAHVIYEHDHFLARRGLNEALEHVPLFPGDRGRPIGAYALARFKDGSDPVFEVMDLDSINRRREVSRAKNAGPWTKWWEEMARKTVFRVLSKWLPMDAETETLMRRDDELGDQSAVVEAIDQETGEVQHISGPAPRRGSKLDAIEHETTIQVNVPLQETEFAEVEERRPPPPPLDETLHGDRITVLDDEKPAAQPETPPAPPAQTEMPVRPPAKTRDVLASAAAKISVRLVAVASQDDYNVIQAEPGIIEWWDRIRSERPELAASLETDRRNALERISAAPPLEENQHQGGA